jgi:hypothetical protein
MKIKHLVAVYAAILGVMVIFLVDVIKLNDRVSQLENMQCDNAYQYKEDQR